MRRLIQVSERARPKRSRARLRKASAPDWPPPTIATRRPATSGRSCSRRETWKKRCPTRAACPCRQRRLASRGEGEVAREHLPEGAAQPKDAVLDVDRVDRCGKAQAAEPACHPRQIVGELGAADGGLARMHELVEAALLDQVGEEGVPAGRIDRRHQVLQERRLQPGRRQELALVPGEGALPLEECAQRPGTGSSRAARLRLKGPMPMPARSSGSLIRPHAARRGGEGYPKAARPPAAAGAALSA